MFQNIERRCIAFSCYQIGQQILHIGSMVFSVWLTMGVISGYVAERVWTQRWNKDCSSKTYSAVGRGVQMTKGRQQKSSIIL